jgi:hypothetical protein
MNLTKALVLAMLLASMPLPAFANSATFQNTGGTLASTNGGTTLTLSGSILTLVGGLGPTFNDSGTNIGSLTLKTGALVSGSLDATALFGPGGSFHIADVNTGLIFDGSFVSATWTPITGLPAGQFGWTLEGTITGTLNGESVSGATVQLTTIVMTNTNPFGPGGSKRIRLSTGGTTVPVVTPELGTLGLLGTGLVGIALVTKRKTRARWSNRSQT